MADARPDSRLTLRSSEKWMDILHVDAAACTNGVRDLATVLCCICYSIYGWMTMSEKQLVRKATISRADSRQVSWRLARLAPFPSSHHPIRRVNLTLLQTSPSSASYPSEPRIPHPYSFFSCWLLSFPTRCHGVMASCSQAFQSILSRSSFLSLTPFHS